MFATTNHDFLHDLRIGDTEVYYQGTYQGDSGVYGPLQGEYRELRVWNNDLPQSTILANQVY